MNIKKREINEDDISETSFKIFKNNILPENFLMTTFSSIESLIQIKFMSKIK